MSPAFLIGQAIGWAVVIVVCMVAMRRSTRRFRERLRAFDHRREVRSAEVLGARAEVDRRNEQRAAAGRARIDRMIAEAAALAASAGPLQEVTISVTLPSDVPPTELDAVVRQLRAATGGRFPIHVDAPAP